MGVAVMASTSTDARSCFIRSLFATPNRCSSSTMRRPRFLKATSLERRRCVPTTTSTVPCRSPSTTDFCSFGDRKRESSSTRAGKAPKRSVKVFQCCWASTVVGTSTATWYPSATALNAARRATSVLPKPTSPATRRSMGRWRSMSFFTSSMARSWSAVSSKRKAASNSCCHGVSAEKAWPSATARAAYSLSSSSAISRRAARTDSFTRCHWAPPRRSSRAAPVSPPRYLEIRSRRSTGR